MQNYFLITFRSITYAQRGQQALRSVGIDCQLRRTPRELSGRGCGYGLLLRSRDALAAAELLRERTISFNKIYAKLPDGTIEERTL